MNLLLETLLFFVKLFYVFLMTIVNWVLPTKYKSVKDEVCLITGAGSGIGRLMALEFARRGASMVLWDVNERGNEETAQMIKEEGGKAFAQKCDVSNREEVYKTAQAARIVVGDITILVNNAGIVYGKNFIDTTDEQIERTMRVNSLAHFWTVRAFLTKMLERNHGHIVTIASIMGFSATAGMTSYVASKHAAFGFNNALECDLKQMKKDGVKTTVVCPYHITTGLFTDVTVRFPSILPSLTPEDCVKAIMHAVLTNQAMVAVPRSMYLMYNMVTWMPHRALTLINEFLGAWEAMAKFVPNRDYQMDAAKAS